jgi:hypothetical protein
MSATTLTDAQLRQVQQVYRDTGSVAQTWRALALSGDQYAQAAYQVIAQPDSSLGRITRGVWEVAGADMSQFDNVAGAHLQNYLNYIQRAENPDGTFSLPTTTQIEQSYGGALTSRGQPLRAAVDIDIQAAYGGSGSGIGPTWSSYLGLNIDSARLRRARHSSLNPSMRTMSFYCAKFGRKRRPTRRSRQGRRSARPTVHTRPLKRNSPGQTGAIGTRPSLAFQKHHAQRAREKMQNLGHLFEGTARKFWFTLAHEGTARPTKQVTALRPSSAFHQRPPRRLGRGGSLMVAMRLCRALRRASAPVAAKSRVTRT